MPCDGCIDPCFRHGDAVQYHCRQIGARKTVSSDSTSVGSTGMIAYKDSCVEGFIDALHHAQRPWPRAD